VVVDVSVADVAAIGIIFYPTDIAQDDLTSYAKTDQPASEKTAKDIANQIERDLGRPARRRFHDVKEGCDRTLEQLKDDARDLYEEARKPIPKWLQR
jgi:hypothetical protein